LPPSIKPNSKKTKKTARCISSQNQSFLKAANKTYNSELFTYKTSKREILGTQFSVRNLTHAI
jgi:hypothetical protein